MQVAVFPLAVPYLLNPAGIVVLVTTSAESASLAVFAVVLGILVLVLALDVVVFRWAVQVSSHLDASRMLVTERCSASCSPRSACNWRSADWPTWA